MPEPNRISRRVEWLTPARFALLVEMFPSTAPHTEILAAIRTLPGPAPPDWHGVSNVFRKHSTIRRPRASSGISAPKTMTAHVGPVLFEPERVDYVTATAWARNNMPDHRVVTVTVGRINAARAALGLGPWIVEAKPR